METPRRQTSSRRSAIALLPGTIALSCTLVAALGGGGRASAQGSVSVGDVTVQETSGGTTTATFSVELIAPLALPPPNGPFDYQLGGAYAPPAGVTIVTRDRTEPPAPGLYNICYVNGFQVQPGEEGDWDYDLILRDENGHPIVDPDWNEWLLDVSVAAKRARIAAVVGGWIEQCAADGFDAVETDNLDSYSRSGGRITQDDAVATMALFVAAAHGVELAIAQKNSAEILGRSEEMGTDFAVAEECSEYDECGDYVAVYGDRVLMIEYDITSFAKGCAEYGATHSIVLRDMDLVTPGHPAYVYDGC